MERAKFRLIGILLAAAMLALGGCATSQPIHNVVGSPVTVAPGKTLSAADVQSAIQRAGASLGWNMSAEAPGRTSGRMAMRNHLAIVDIEYDAKSYSIKYRDSSNLNARDGMIHKAYNEWVMALDRAIRSQLLQL